MILYNVTVKIENNSHDDWLKWMKEVHIPEVLDTGLFEEYKICRILHDDPEGETYAIQYFCKDMDTFKRYQTEYAPKLQAEHQKRYKNKYVAFRTLMEVL